MAAPKAPSPGTCIFCDIATGRAPAHIVDQDATTVTFLDLFPITRGHLLVIPRTHVDRFTDLPEADYPGLLRAVRRACERVERLSAHYNLSVNQGALAGQIVFHLHFHVIPRYEDAEPAWTKPRGRLADSEAVQVLERLRAG
jgi:histidine triad (HIT) family protein